MGRYMRKAKIMGEVAVMEFSLGVRTRAKTLALQRLQNAADQPQNDDYLQLRSRRLVKSPVRGKGPRRGEEEEEKEKEEKDDGGVEVSFGENVLEIESRERDARESTPCSFSLDSELLKTPGSCTRSTSTNAANRRRQSAALGNIPTSEEIEEFFSSVESQQQRSFMERYNYDPVSDCPLPGRYEWVKLNTDS